MRRASRSLSCGRFMHKLIALLSGLERLCGMVMMLSRLFSVWQEKVAYGVKGHSIHVV